MNWQIFLGDHPYSVDGKIVTFNAIESESAALAVAQWIVRCRTPNLHPEMLLSVLVRKVESDPRTKPCLLFGHLKP